MSILPRALGLGFRRTYGTAALPNRNGSPGISALEWLAGGNPLKSRCPDSQLLCSYAQAGLFLRIGDAQLLWV
jgi:hypothetical protein